MIKKHKWGYGLTLVSRDHIKIKLLYFRSGGKLSLQRHHYRNELWAFIFGRGLMGLGDFPDDLVRHDSKTGYFTVQKFVWHQYEALKRTLVLEVQYGKKCEESDIEKV